MFEHVKLSVYNNSLDIDLGNINTRVLFSQIYLQD